MKPINHYTTIYTRDEIQLANEIAEQLHDPTSLSQFLRFTKEVPHEFLRKALNKACSTPDHLITSSRAAILLVASRHLNNMAMVTLGISLGTTTVGIAIIDDKELIKWHTHSFRALWSDAKAEAITKHFCRYIERHNIQLVVLKLPPLTHRPPSVQQLLNQLNVICKRYGCEVQTITRRELRRAIPEISNNSNLMRFVAEHYPVVVPEYERALKRKNHYHKKVFEAIAAAHHGRSTSSFTS